jgi:hypothetical protein
MNTGTLPLVGLNITLGGENTTRYSNETFQTPFVPDKTQTFEPPVSNTYTLYSKYGYLVEAAATDGSTFTSFYNVQSEYYDVWPRPLGIARTITFSFSGLDDLVTQTILEVDGRPYSWGDMPSGALTFPPWIIGSAHSFAWMSPFDVTGGTYSLLGVSGLSTEQSATITVPSTNAEIRATYSGFVAQLSQIVFNVYLTNGAPGFADVSGIVLTIDGATYNTFPQAFDWPVGETHSYAWSSPLSRSGGGNYLLEGVAGLETSASGDITATGTGGTVTATYSPDTASVVFRATLKGSSDFGLNPTTVLTADGHDYTQFPVSPPWEVGCSYSYSWHSSVVAGGRQFLYNSSVGLNEAQEGTVTVPAGGGTITAIYIEPCTVSFSVSGLLSNPQILTVDDANFTRLDLPKAFAWEVSDVHYFCWLSTVTIDEHNYSLVSVTGLSSRASASLTAPSGGGWVSATYTADNVTVMKQVSFYGEGLGGSAVGKVVVRINGVDQSYNGDPLLYSCAYPNGTVITYQYLDLYPNATLNPDQRFLWQSTSGLSATKSGTLTVTVSGDVNAMYQEQYRVLFDEEGLHTPVSLTGITILNINPGPSHHSVAYNDFSSTQSIQNPGFYEWWQNEGTTCNYQWVVPLSVSGLPISWINNRNVIRTGVSRQEGGYDFTCTFVMDASGFPSVVTGSVSSAQTVKQRFYTKWYYSGYWYDAAWVDGYSVEVTFPECFVRYAFGTFTAFYTGGSPAGPAAIYHRFGTGAYSLDASVGQLFDGQPQDVDGYLAAPLKPSPSQYYTWIKWQLGNVAGCKSQIENVYFIGIPYWADNYNNIP